MDSCSVEDVVYAQRCTGQSVLLAVCCAVEQANLRKHGPNSPGWEHNITNHLRQPITEWRAAGVKLLAGTRVFGYRSLLNYIYSVYLRKYTEVCVHTALKTLILVLPLCLAAVSFSQ